MGVWRNIQIKVRRWSAQHSIRSFVRWSVISLSSHRSPTTDERPPQSPPPPTSPTRIAPPAVVHCMYANDIHVCWLCTREPIWIHTGLGHKEIHKESFSATNNATDVHIRGEGRLRSLTSGQWLVSSIRSGGVNVSPKYTCPLPVCR